MWSTAALLKEELHSYCQSRVSQKQRTLTKVIHSRSTDAVIITLSKCIASHGTSAFCCTHGCTNGLPLIWPISLVKQMSGVKECGPVTYPSKTSRTPCRHVTLNLCLSACAMGPYTLVTAFSNLCACSFYTVQMKVNKCMLINVITLISQFALTRRWRDLTLFLRHIHRLAQAATVQKPSPRMYILFSIFLSRVHLFSR